MEDIVPAHHLLRSHLLLGVLVGVEGVGAEFDGFAERLFGEVFGLGVGVALDDCKDGDVRDGREMEMGREGGRDLLDRKWPKARSKSCSFTSARTGSCWWRTCWYALSTTTRNL